MDEFDRIREFSEDISKRKEPSFESLKESSDTSEETDDATLYAFKESALNNGKLPELELEEKEFSSMKLHLIALGIFATVLIVVLIGFLMFNDSSEESEVVMVSATSDPVKVKPLDAGGMKIPDQDKMVYDRLRSNVINTKVESLFPEPEQPVAPDILQAVVQEENFVSIDETKPMNPLTEEIPVAPKVEAIALPEKVEKPVQPVVKAEKKTAPKKVTAVAKGKWSAQLLSGTKKESVEKAWPQILAKNKALLSNMSYAIVKADIPGKGTYYRLRVGNFQTREQANTLCKKLKARKQDCVPAN